MSEGAVSEGAVSEGTAVAVASIDPAAFREALGHYPTGVALVTATMDDGELVGMVVGTFNSVSLDPPLVSFMPDKGSRTFARLREATSFCVNVLPADQVDLVGRWRGAESFAEVAWHPSPSGAPVLDAAVTWIDCTYHQIVDAGDHHIVLGAVQALDVQRPASPLLFFQGGFGGFAPPSFLAPAERELIRAARYSEAALEPLGTLARDLRADVSLLALVGDHDVVIATERGSSTPTYLEVGLRLPMLPPAGAIYLPDGDDEALERWLDRLPRKDQANRERCRTLAAKITHQGYALSLVGEGPDQETWQDVTRYIHGEATPRGHRQVLNMHLEHLDYYEPELVDGERYDVRSITAPVPLQDEPKLAVRLSFPPGKATAATVTDWCAQVQASATEVADLIQIRFHQGTAR